MRTEQKDYQSYRRQLCIIRDRAHREFDSLWKQKPGHRRAGYRSGCYSWLRREMGMTKSECHFGQFDIGVCEAVISLVREVKVGLRPGPTFNSTR